MAETRYERLHPAELEAIVEHRPLAYVPIGTLEYHGAHLPFGVDSFEAHGLCVRAAERSGGVVLPPAYLASGCLDMPFTLTFDHELVHAWVSATIAQLAHRGFRTVVVLTGHGPLDLNHLLKRVCREAEAAHDDLRAYGLCWLELNAARLRAPEDDEPTVVDHAARIETSWMLALEPDLVHLDRLADDPVAQHPGIYGPNPRFTASEAFGRDQIDAAAGLLAERAASLAEGGELDPLADLRAFVRHGWPEQPTVSAVAGPPPTLLLRNEGRASRYLSSVEVAVDGAPVPAGRITLVNRNPGETGVPVRANAVDAEHGFYVRRAQTASIELGGLEMGPGEHEIEVALGLGGVARAVVRDRLAFA